MKRRLLLLLAPLLLAAAVRAAPVPPPNCSTFPLCANSQTITASGSTVSISSNGGLTTSFEELMTGTPATVSVVIQGCAAGGTCTTLDTNTTVATGAIRSPTITVPYSYYTVTASWTGGTAPTVTINSLLTTARNGSGSSSGPADIQVTVGTTAIPANGCLPTNTTYNTAAMTGLTSTMAVNFSPGVDISAVTGWSVATPGLYFNSLPAANSLGWQVCNGSAASITPGSSTTWNVAAK